MNTMLKRIWNEAAVSSVAGVVRLRTELSRVRRHSELDRSGVTLTEVLMSLAIMGIGIVMVATLFPLSTLRVLDASIQTNSTITRFSSEALISVDPSFVHNPDGYFDPAGTGADVTPYNSQAFRGQVYFVDPYGWQTFHRDAGLQLAFPFIPLRDYLGQLPPGSPVNIALPRRYTGATMFVSAAINPYPSIATDSDLAISRALDLVGQPDNWKLIAETSVATSATPVPGITSIILDTDADMSTVKVGPMVSYRAVIFDLDGRSSEVRTLTTNPSGQTLAFTPALPSRFETAPSGASPNVGKVRIEVLDEVYTWALSVRKRPGGSANVDVVVFFKRSFKPDHEYVYPAPLRPYTLGADGFPGSPGDDNLNGVPNDVGEIGYPGSDDAPNTIVKVNYSTLPAGADAPVFRKGGYVCDTKNGLWYRIQAIQNENAALSTVDLVLDKFIQLANTEDLNGNGTVDAALGEDTFITDGTLQSGGLYWNPSVVNVFPLEIKEP